MICGACYLANKDCPACGGVGMLPDPPDPTRGVKKDIRLFGTAGNELHSSFIPQMMECNWKAALVYLFSPEDESSEAKNTGSAMHVAVAEWHRKKDVAAAIDAMRERANEYPRASFDEAAAMFFLYVRDPRNTEAQIYTDDTGLWVERKISFSLAPHAEDITQAPIEIVGTLDQIRMMHSRPSVWDLKTSKRSGWDLLNSHLYQLACYAIGACSKLMKPVRMGGLITPRHYKQQAPEFCPNGVFWEFPHRFDDLAQLINSVRLVVANIRAGHVYLNPGDYCRYCVAKGTEGCTPMLKQATDPVTNRIALRTA